MDKITEASHRLCAALHDNLIDPAQMEIYLPADEWWRLACHLERKYPSTMPHDGRGQVPTWFKFMGIIYRPK